jgi:hypothetical protein
MSYLVFVTFDLKAASAQDYANAYADLDKLGLKRVHVGSNGNAVIPTTSAMGTFNSTSSDKAAVDIRTKVAAAFTARKFKAEIFVVAGENGTWASIST